jgi:hypothetical protein
MCGVYAGTTEVPLWHVPTRVRLPAPADDVQPLIQTAADAESLER